MGAAALVLNTDGFSNTAVGDGALRANMTGSFNVAIGFQSCASLTDGRFNIVLGNTAGLNLTTGSNNICIGHAGTAGSSNTILIGTIDTHTATRIAGIWGANVDGGTDAPVIVDSSGKLGTNTSSRRFKQDIADMAATSEAILRLRPVTFRYTPETARGDHQRFGLIAEEVDEVNPELVLRDAKGEINGVRYEAVNAMLLNEFLKDHRRVEAQAKIIAEHDRRFAAQAEKLATLEARDRAREARLSRLENALDGRSLPAMQKVFHRTPNTTR